MNPDYAEAHDNLGAALSKKGRLDDAIAEYHRALELKPDYAEAHANLGVALYRKGRLDDAIDEFREALELNPDYANAHNSLGSVLEAKGQLDDAIVEYNDAIKLNPTLLFPHINLSIALRQKGNFFESLEAIKLAHQLGAGNPRWPYPTKQWVEEAEQLVRLDEEFTRLLNASEQPADAAEQVALAEFALVHKHRPVIAAGWFREALAADLALVNAHRYNAACAAALAAAATNAEELRDDEREAWRNQAREWLTAELEAIRKLAENPEAKAQLFQALSHWLKDPDLAGIRDSDRLKELPEAEREAFNALWRDVKLVRDAEPLAAAERRLQSAPDDAVANNDLALNLATCPEAKLRDPQRAVKLAKRAVELAPQEGGHWNTMGVAHYRAGDWHAAIESLKKSDQLLAGQHFSANAFFLAMAFCQLDSKDDARKWFEQAVTWMEKNQPQNEELQRFRAEAVELLGTRESTRPQPSADGEADGDSRTPE